MASTEEMIEYIERKLEVDNGDLLAIDGEIFKVALKLLKRRVKRKKKVS